MEALYGSWRAWTHLIPPHTRALNLAAKYVPAMRTFIDPDASDGPVRPIGYGPERVAEVRALLERTLAEQRQLLDLASAIQYLDALVVDQSGSLEGLYAQVPDALRGYVELVYDRANNATVRFIEALLYADHAREDLQGARLAEVTADDPGLGLVTPRLDVPRTLGVTLPFLDPAWDALAAARLSPLPLGRFQELLDTSDDQLNVLRTFLTDTPPIAVTREPPEAGVRIRFFGHACLLVESARSSVLVDPLIAYRRPDQRDRLSFSDLPPRVDVVAITHGHMDHFDVETLLQLRHRVDTIVVPRSGGGDLADPSLKLAIRALGFRDIVEIDEMEEYPLPDGGLFAVPFFGEHGDMNVRAKSGYVIRAGEKAVLCTADARNVDTQMYRHVRRWLGSVDAAFIGLECEGSPLTLANGPYLARPATPDEAESRRTNASDCDCALGIISALEPTQVYVYAMGLEPWLRFMFGVPDESRSYSMAQVRLLIDICGSRGIHSELLRSPREIHA